MKPVHRVYAFAATTRITTLILAIVSYLWSGSYDSSAEISLNPSTVMERCLTALLRWDALYFKHIAEHGYVYEQEHAFFPVLPFAARVASHSVIEPLLGVSSACGILLSGLLITNICFVLAAGVLYRLTRVVQARLAMVSAVAFCLSPPAAFMSSLYTESPFALLSFLGMLWYVEKQYIWAALVWGLASGVRSNAIVYVGFFIYDLILRKRTLGRVFLACICGSLTMAGFGMFQYYGYRSFCLGLSTNEPRAWCTASPPLLYTFVQKHYWGNGFLAYYEVKQIPNFLTAMPILWLSVAGILRYARQDWRSFFWSLGLNDKERSKTAPFIYLWTVLTVYSATCMHIQVIIRFFTSMPPLYWYIGELWTAGLGPASNKKINRLANGILEYQVLYGLVGIVLFATFLPPA